MPRQATGQAIEREGRRGRVYALRRENGRGPSDRRPDPGDPRDAHPLAGRDGLHRAGRLRHHDVDRKSTQPEQPSAGRAAASRRGGEHRASPKTASPIGPITFHSLRRTYASLRCACGDDIRYTSGQLGHEDPRFSLRVYAQATRRRERLSSPHRKAHDRALEWTGMGTSALDELEPIPTEATKNPA
jgi:integrase